jgi:hypothetical protein
LNPVPEKCLIRHVLVCPSEIHFLRFILEAYEGIAVATTLDPGLGLMRLSIAPGCEDEVAEILSFEKERLQLKDAAPDAGSSFQSLNGCASSSHELNE